MFQYRQALVQMRQGDSDRQIAAGKVMGRPKAAALRAVALAKGWLQADRPLPEDAEIAAAVGRPQRAARARYRAWSRFAARSSSGSIRACPAS